MAEQQNNVNRMLVRYLLLAHQAGKRPDHWEFGKIGEILLYDSVSLEIDVTSLSRLAGYPVTWNAENSALVLEDGTRVKIPVPGEEAFLSDITLQELQQVAAKSQ